MKLIWKSNKTKKSVRIEKMVTSLTWSGADTQASRTVEFDLVNSPYDPEIKRPNVKTGDIISWYSDDGKKRFVGRVTSREKTSDIGTVKITAKDYMHNMISSKGSYKFKNKTPEYITRSLCKDIGISVGKLKATKTKIQKYLPDDMSYYDMIIKAYQKVSGKTHKKYMPRMNGTKFEIIEKGKIIENFALKDTVDITHAEYTENIDSMVNKVVVYNSKNQKIGTMKKPEWVKKYGVYQTTLKADNHKESVSYYTDKGKKKNKKKTVAAKKLNSGAKAKAKKEFVGPSQTATLECIGHIGCISGRGVRVIDHATGLTSTYWIKSDEHKFENGNHTMTLELAFKNSMENVTYNKYQASKSGSSSGSYGGGSYYYTAGKKYPADFSAYGTYFNNSGNPMHSNGAYGQNTAYKTVAGPPSFARKYLRISGTGTKWDGQIVRVTDTGKDSNGKLFSRVNGRWRFDVCEKTYAEAAKFGRHNGYVTVMTKHKNKTENWGGGKIGWPCHGTITTQFGQRRSWDPYSKAHTGMDIAVSTGTPIHACADGTVTLASMYGGFGNCVIINHGNGLTSLYGHNSSLKVVRGQKVKRGQVIARAGSTGFSTGPHCHFQITLHGKLKNPMKYLR